MSKQAQRQRNMARRQVHGRGRKPGTPSPAASLLEQHTDIRHEHPATPATASEVKHVLGVDFVEQLAAGTIARPATYAIDTTDDLVSALRSRIRRAALKSQVQIATQRSSAAGKFHLLVHVED